jgi:hypothetical protein
MAAGGKNRGAPEKGEGQREEDMLQVKAVEPIRFPNYGWGWLSTRAVGPERGRVLVEVRGHSGQSSWPEILLTAPESAVSVIEEKEISLLPGVYRVEEGQDRRGMRLLRFYLENADGDTNLIMFGANGFLVPEASDPQSLELARAQGKSRTGQNGDRFALIVAPVGAIVAIESYYRRNKDPVYFKVEETGVVELGETDAVLHPSEW